MLYLVYLSCIYHHNGGRFVLAHLYPLGQDRTFELKVSPRPISLCRRDEGRRELRKCDAVAGSPDRGRNEPGEAVGRCGVSGDTNMYAPTIVAI